MDCGRRGGEREPAAKQASRPASPLHRRVAAHQGVFVLGLGAQEDVAPAGAGLECGGAPPAGCCRLGLCMPAVAWVQRHGQGVVGRERYEACAHPGVALDRARPRAVQQVCHAALFKGGPAAHGRSTLRRVLPRGQTLRNAAFFSLSSAARWYAWAWTWVRLAGGGVGPPERPRPAFAAQSPFHRVLKPPRAHGVRLPY